MIQLIDKDDVKKERIHIKNEEETTNITVGPITARLSLIDAEEMIDELKAQKIDEKEKIIIRQKVKKNKRYHLLRWNIRRSNTLTITSGFKGGHGIKLPIIKID